MPTVMAAAPPAEPSATPTRVPELLAQHGSPLWLADVDRVRMRWREFGAAWRAAWPEVEVAYSYKTNRLLAFLVALDGESARPEVVTDAEYELAREVVGAAGGSIVVNGPAKPARLLERAAADGALIIVDSRAELERVAAAGGRRVGLRISVAGFSGRPSRFGIAPREVAAAVRRALALGLRVEALSAHLVSTDFAGQDGARGPVAVSWPRGPERHVEAATLLARAARELATSLGLQVETLDLGGGFPAAPAVSEHAHLVAEALHAEGFTGHLLLEPGRAVVHDAVELACTVVADKRLADGTRSVIVDAGTDLVPGAAQSPPPIDAPGNPGPRTPALLSGPLCLNVDVLHPRAALPPLEPGAALVIGAVGAYAQAASTQFGEPRPAVLAREGGRERLVRRRERLEDVMAPELDLAAQRQDYRVGNAGRPQSGLTADGLAAGYTSHPTKERT